MLAGFDEAVARATVADPGAGAVAELDLSLAEDLGLEPVNLLVGGEGEVWARARAALLRTWARGEGGLADAMGPLPDGDLATFLAQVRPYDLDAAAAPRGAPSLADLLERAAVLRRVLADARPMGPADLGAGAAVPLDAAAHLAALEPGIGALARRAEALAKRLDSVRTALGPAAEDVLARAREIDRLDRLPQVPGARDRPAELAALEAARGPLDALLDAASRFALPDALRPAGTGEVVRATEAYAGLLRDLAGRLDAKLRALREALTASQVPAGDVAAARGVLDGLARAVRDACDGDAVVVLPPVGPGPATAPVVGAPRLVGDALGGWPAVRPALERLAELAPMLPDLRALETAPTPTTDPRHPAVSHHGAYVAPGGRLPGGAACGLVIDEWTDVRPASTQVTGLAVNFDSPQSEPPHALLLGVAPNDGMTDWDDAAAASLVVEAIRLMRVRALPSRDGSVTRLGLGALNLVPPTDPPGQRLRIPVGPRLAPIGDRRHFGFGRRGTMPLPGATASGLDERRPPRGRR